MNQSKIKPIYAYVPVELHDFLDQVKQEAGINKSDMTYMAVTFMQRFSMEQLMKFSDCLLMHGPDGLKKMEIN